MTEAEFCREVHQYWDLFQTFGIQNDKLEFWNSVDPEDICVGRPLGYINVGWWRQHAKIPWIEARVIHARWRDYLNWQKYLPNSSHIFVPVPTAHQLVEAALEKELNHDQG